MALGSLLAGVGSALLSSKGQSDARRSNEALLDEIRKLFSGLGSDVFGGTRTIEGQEQPLSYKEWLNSEGKDFIGGDSKQAINAYNQYKEDFVPSDTRTETVTGDFDQMAEILASRLGVAQEGFGRARQELSRTADASRTQAYDLHKQTMADATQRAISSGRYNTSFLDNAQRGIAADTSRRLQEIDSRLAGLQADLSTREAGVQTGLLGDLANMFGQKAGLRTQQTQGLASILGGTTYTASPVNLGGIGASLDSLFAGGSGYTVDSQGLAQGGGFKNLPAWMVR